MDSFVLKNRRGGQTLAMKLTLFDSLKDGKSIFLYGNDNPEKIVEWLKENELDVIADPVYKTHQERNDQETGVRMRFKLENPILQGYNFKLKDDE